MTTERQKLIDGHDVNHTGDSQKILPETSAHSGNEDSFFRRNKCKIIIVGLICLAALIIGLAVGLTRGSDPIPDPYVPPGPTPKPPQEFNPYTIDEGSLKVQVNEVSGTVTANLTRYTQQMSSVNLNGEHIKATPKVIPEGMNNALFNKVYFEFGQVTHRIAKALFTEYQVNRFSIPEDLIPKPQADPLMKLEAAGFSLINEPFGFKFVDPLDTSNVLLTTQNQSFIMWDKYMQLDLILPSQRIFGLGQRNREFALTEGTWTMWSIAAFNPYDDGTGGKQTYSVHPFVLVQTKQKGEFMGIFFRNTNMQSPVVQNMDDGRTLFSYITTGGQIEVYFFFKGSPSNIISQYQNMVGKPNLPPFYTLGWHSASYAYNTQEKLQENIEGYKTNGFPLEGVWLDIDYMDNRKAFTVNNTAFPTIKNYTKELQAEGKHLMLIVDPGIYSDDPTYVYYSQAVQADVLIKSSINAAKEGGYLTTSQLNNSVVLLDYLANDTKAIWEQGLKDLHDLIPYDGLWFDLNEATAFCNGECPDNNANKGESVQDKAQIVKDRLQNLINNENSNETVNNYTWWFSYGDQDDNSTYFLPFIPGLLNLDNWTLSLNATHKNGESEYNLHSLFGHSQAKMSYEILTNQSTTFMKDKRPFILSRSTVPGTGQYIQTWLGDNQRTPAEMKRSIAGIMNSNMFGIPMVGAEVCGWYGEADQFELCGRWAQLSTFYPFARQHFDKTGGGGQPEIWRMPEPYKTWAKNALFDRLQYVRHMYTCLFEASTEGGTCFDPLFYYYPELDEAFNNIESTIIVAGTFKVSPVLELGVATYKSYFPNGAWVSMKNFGDVTTVINPSGGDWVTLNAPNDTVNVHLRPGKIATFQDNRNQNKSLTKDMNEDKRIQYIVNRDESHHANIKSFFDDGETLSQLESKQYEWYQFLHNGKSFIKQNLNINNTASQGFYLDKLVITRAADLMNVDTACYIRDDGTVFQLNVTYDKDMSLLNITARDDQNPSDFQFINMTSVHYLQRGVDINHCDQYHDYYSPSGEPDLSGNMVSFDLSSGTQAFKDVTMHLSILASGALNVKWNYKDLASAEKKPFEIPQPIIDVDRSQLKAGAKLSDYVSITHNTGPVIISILKDGVKQYEIQGFLLATYLNYIDSVAYTSTPFNGIMGVIEQVQDSLFMKDGTYSLWSHDAPNPEANGKLPASNKYGVHPYFMAKTQNGWLGVYQNNAAAQDWEIHNNPIDGNVKVVMRATGGLGDMFILLGSSANEVVEMFHTIVGKPVQVPQWTLGWGQCRYGYQNLTKMQEVVDKYAMYNLPLDNMFVDIDHMDNYKDFTYDKLNFNGLPEFVTNLTKVDIQFLPILDAGVSKRPGSNYSAYTQGAEKGVFIKNAQGGVFTGRVWPGDTAFVDWFHDDAEGWWHDQLDAFAKELNFSGFWLDMNEATNFCDGVCYDSEAAMYPVKTKLEYIPTGRDLESESISLDAKHSNGYTQLDTHSLYAVMMNKATHTWFQKENKRTFLLSRSMFAGQGKFASKWSADNWSTEQSMGYSITDSYQHNIMGIPLFGADVCGFNLNTTPELCARWYNVAAFYTWSRNHKNFVYESQEPYLFAGQIYEGTISYLDIIQKAMWTKFVFVKHMYSSLLNLSENGGTFHRPLFFEFDQDLTAYTASQELNVMLGSSLKLSINSNKLGRNTTEFYFPEGAWCSVLKGLGTQTCLNVPAGGQNVTLPSKAYDAYVHLRNASIVPMQNGQSILMTHNVTTTAGLANFPMQLHINPYCSAGACFAHGTFNNDDGIVFDNTNMINKYNFTLSSTDLNTITLNIDHLANATSYPDNHVNTNDQVYVVRLYNAQQLTINVNYTVAVTLLDDQTVTYDDASYNAQWDSLQFANADPFAKPIWMSDIKNIIFTKK